MARITWTDSGTMMVDGAYAGGLSCTNEIPRGVRPTGIRLYTWVVLLPDGGGIVRGGDRGVYIHKAKAAAEAAYRAA